MSSLSPTHNLLGNTFFIATNPELAIHVLDFLKPHEIIESFSCINQFCKKVALQSLLKRAKQLGYEGDNAQQVKKYIQVAVIYFKNFQKKTQFKYDANYQQAAFALLMYRLSKEQVKLDNFKSHDEEFNKNKRFYLEGLGTAAQMFLGIRESKKTKSKDIVLNEFAPALPDNQKITLFIKNFLLPAHLIIDVDETFSYTKNFSILS